MLPGRTVSVELLMESAGVPDAGNTEPPHAGSGTLTDPWLINSEELLRKVGTDDASGWGLDDHYRLSGDITLSDALWEPIGKHLQGSGDYSIPDPVIGDPFTGSFDGAGRTIFKLTVQESNAPADIAQGMFSYIGEGGAVRNLTLENVSVTNEDAGIGRGDYCDVTGGIAGVNAGTIENCAVSGTVSDMNGQSVGGVAGVNRGTVQICVFSGDVSGWNTSYSGITYNVGGAVGDNMGAIQKCSVSADIFGRGNSSQYVGGIAGDNNRDMDYRGTITNCSAAGRVSGAGSQNCVGGITGSNNSTVQNSYAENLLSSGYYVGGIEGNYSGLIQNCVALSLNITNTNINITHSTGRIITLPGASSSLDGNYGREDMMLNGNPYFIWSNQVFDSGSGLVEGSDGTDVNASQYENPEWWKNPVTWSGADLSDEYNTAPAGTPWDFATVWDWDAAAKRPVLRK